MSVRPDDLANLCALYSVLGANRINPPELEKYVQKSMLIESTSSACQIIDEATNCGLLAIRSAHYVLTDHGRQLGKLQKQVDYQISERAKDFLIKKVYLNPDTGPACCSDFLISFRADTQLTTFVFDRHESEAPKETRWLQTLSRVGLVEVDTVCAKVNRNYLDAVNEVLRKTRNELAGEEPEAGDDREKIGKVAEKCAMEYEKQRLLKSGHQDLGMLVQRISLVDKSAGYDISSYRGTGKKPDSPIFIEVKGTTKPEVDFIWTKNERFVARQERRSYWIYAFTNVDLDIESATGPVRINDPIVNLEHKGYSIEALSVHVRK